MLAIFKASSPFKKQTKTTIVCDIFTSCVFLWWCFLKNNINHPLFLSRRKSTCEWLPFGFLGLKSCISKNLCGQKKKKCNHASKTQYFCWTQWVVSESKGRFSPYTNPPTRAHIQSARIHACSWTETYTHQSTGQYTEVVYASCQMEGVMK